MRNNRSLSQFTSRPLSDTNRFECTKFCQFLPKICNMTDSLAAFCLSKINRDNN